MQQPGNTEKQKGVLDRLPKLGRVSQLILIVGVFVLIFVPLLLIYQQQEPKRSRDQAWLFQPELLVEDPAGQAIFITRPARKNRERGDPVGVPQREALPDRARGTPQRRG